MHEIYTIEEDFGSTTAILLKTVICLVFIEVVGRIKVRI